MNASGITRRNRLAAAGGRGGAAGVAYGIVGIAAGISLLLRLGRDKTNQSNERPSPDDGDRGSSTPRSSFTTARVVYVPIRTPNPGPRFLPASNRTQARADIPGETG